MGTTADLGKHWQRDFVTDGVPTSGANPPAKADGRATIIDADTRLTILEAVAIVVGSSTPVVAETTRAAGAESTLTTNLAAEVTRATAAEALKAPLASPALTGTPTAPTATAGTSTTQLATTAFATGAITANTTAITAETTRATAAEALKAPLASPALTGTPTAPTATAGTSTTQLATTAFATAAGASNTTAVTAEVTRATAAEALLAPLASPALTGTPTAPTATAGTSTTQLATTAFVTAAVGDSTSIAAETTRATAAEALLAPLASPALTGVPTAPTATAGTNTTQLATTAFAAAAAASTTSAADTTNATAITTETTRATAAEALKAPLASPALTGTPTAPTATAGTSTTQLATTAFVAAAAGNTSSITAETNRATAAEALLAPLASPALTGTPTAPTATAGTSTTQLATTAFVAAAAGNTTSITAETNRATAAEALLAPLASPALTGTPTAPTATAGTSTTQLATTAFVAAAAGNTTSITAETNRATAAEALLAPLASPALTGTPTAPTATLGSNTTQLATTAFVSAAALAATGVPSFATLASAKAQTVAASIQTLLVLSALTAGDLRGDIMVFKRVAAAPTFNTSLTGQAQPGWFRSTDRFLPNGSTDATNGGYWLLAMQEVNVFMFGAFGTGSSSQDDWPAINAGVTFAANFLAASPSTYHDSLVHLRFPANGAYYSSQTIAITKAMRISGDWKGDGNNGYGMIIFPNGVTGMTVANGANVGQSTHVSGLFFLSSDDPTGAFPLAHGFVFNAIVNVEECGVQHFSGCGFIVNGYANPIPSIPTVSGFADTTHLRRCFVTQVGRHGFWNIGGDANVNKFEQCSANELACSGFKDEASFTVTYDTCHAAGCGTVLRQGQLANGLGPLAQQGGIVYLVMPVRSLTGPFPSATTVPGTDPTVWLPTNLSTAGVPAWVSGGLYLEGGCYVALTGTTLFLNCYIEGITGFYSYISPQATAWMVGGTIGDHIFPESPVVMQPIAGKIVTYSPIMTQFTPMPGSLIGDQVITVTLGARGQHNSTKTIQSTNLSNWYEYINLTGDLQTDASLSSGFVCNFMTGINTTRQFGSGVNQPAVFTTPRLGIQALYGGPADIIIGAGLSPPTTGSASRGWFIFNNLPLSTPSSPVGWTCIFPGTNGVGGTSVWVPVYSANGYKQQKYSTNSSTSPTTALLAADILGALVEYTLNLTGAIVAASNAQLPTVAALVAAIIYPVIGQTYKLRIINGGGSGSGVWTITTNTGWTLNGTMTIGSALGYRDFYVTLTSLTAATLQSLGGGTITAI